MPFYLDAVLQTPPGFPLSRVTQCRPLQKLFSPLGFSSVYSTLLGVFHPVRSLQPQWGHFYIIHFFRNTSQTNWASGENTQRVIFDLLLKGTSIPSRASELFIWDQHWLKWVLLCQWYALCFPKMIVFGLLFVLLWLVKTKLVSFDNINSNVVDTQ